MIIKKAGMYFRVEHDVLPVCFDCEQSGKFQEWIDKHIGLDCDGEETYYEGWEQFSGDLNNCEVCDTPLYELKGKHHYIGC